MKPIIPGFGQSSAGRQPKGASISYFVAKARATNSGFDMLLARGLSYYGSAELRQLWRSDRLVAS
jgi:hypothetical protein